MGGCLTKSKKKSSGHFARVPSTGREAHPEPESSHDDEEEAVETVKEVLSETPNPKPSTPSDEHNKIEKAETPETPTEIPSFMKGFSAPATEVTELRKSSPDVKPHRKRSLSGELPSCRRGRCAAASAAWGNGGGGSARSSPSPARRREGGWGRTPSAREAGPAATARSRVPVLCREPGERSARRSVSPAAAQAKEHRRSLSAAAAAARSNAPRRVPAQRRGPCDDEGANEYHYSGGKETLENPLVSLECFIFL